MKQSSDIDLHYLTLTDPFWRDYQRLVRDVVLPYQWAALNDQVADAQPSHAIENFRIAAGQSQGEFYGMVFQDSDVAKWLEAVAWMLCQQPDEGLETTADGVIELIAAAQQPDGYLNTYFTVKAPEARWTNLAECHELYCAGHMIEAGVAYYRATGKPLLLQVVCRLADHIDGIFGPGEHQLHGYPGHPEIELALMILHEVTDNPRHLELARYFVEQRGREPHFYDSEYQRRGCTSYWHNYGPAWMVLDKAYSQAHLPIAQQETAVGHAVRFVYLMAGVAHLAHVSRDEEKRQSCRRLWNNMTQRRMYITGGIGSQSQGEAFTGDYDLPNDTAYTESCASIGLMMFARRMLQMEADGEYADVMERALYNTVLAGMALDGKHFFYVNPLEVHPAAIRCNHIYDHVKPVRQQWFGCACCPPNIARILGSLGHYIYTQTEDALLVNLYIGSELTVDLGSQSLTLRQRGNYPWDEVIELSVDCPVPVTTTLALRLPAWCPSPSLILNGQAILLEARRGYAYLTRQWSAGDTLRLTLPMPVRRVRSHPGVRQNQGKAALQRGPLVYCLEQADNGADLHNLRLSERQDYQLVAGEGVLAGKTLIRASGERVAAIEGAAQPLYRFDGDIAPRQAHPLLFIPYFCWANRAEGEMRVWVDEQSPTVPCR
ncbi:beta-L-arabinofuranosidase domain-containing protein [Acerihabitans sp. TG2]|uniref:glycoside hydrolase family 127 protein n=1 Tax=Acerihabitans sp. TG2 TaxID=3096008 RepID=UPI002B23BE90|nr:beta-L-arabinofuranosidase domain-containing protein [Acerihabitans sp. TG2]MEA9391442.1 beta-L-arabinofuranosidase domain-containing protein [Acerihabitans sp. TG2]